MADNVALPAMIAGEKPRLYRPRAMELLERVDLGDRARGTRCRSCRAESSRGWRYAGRCCGAPGLLLADEPTGNLDDDNGRRVMELMTDLVDHEGATLVYVTHSREFATLADEVWETAQRRVEPTVGASRPRVIRTGPPAPDHVHRFFRRPGQVN